MNIGFLDGVRGFMALWVLASHLIQRANGPDIFLVKGGIAVDVFMMVSGILMAHNIYARREKESMHDGLTWRRFYVRRFFRIAPLYYFAFACAMVFSEPLAVMANELGGTNSSGVSQWDDFLQNVAAHLTFTFGLFPRWASSNVLPDWSLSLEMQFYAVFPLLLLFMRRSAFLFLAVVVFFVYVGNQSICVYSRGDDCFFYPQPSVLILKLGCFAAGMILVHGVVEARSVASRVLAALAFMVFVIYSQRLTFSVLALGCAFMYVGAMRGYANKLIAFVFSVFDRILSSSPSRFLGDISYGVYLCHFFVLFPVLYWSIDYGFYEIDSPWTRFLISCVIVGLPSILLARVLHRFVELRGIAVGRLVCDKYLR